MLELEQKEINHPRYFTFYNRVGRVENLRIILFRENSGSKLIRDCIRAASGVQGVGGETFFLLMGVFMDESIDGKTNYSDERPAIEGNETINPHR